MIIGTLKPGCNVLMATEHPLTGFTAFVITPPIRVALSHLWSDWSRLLYRCENGDNQCRLSMLDLKWRASTSQLCCKSYRIKTSWTETLTFSRPTCYMRDLLDSPSPSIMLALFDPPYADYARAAPARRNNRPAAANFHAFLPQLRDRSASQ